MNTPNNQPVDFSRVLICHRNSRQTEAGVMWTQKEGGLPRTIHYKAFLLFMISVDIVSLGYYSVARFCGPKLKNVSFNVCAVQL